MKKILCLTDLSESSKSGIRFANELARRQSASLIFMHTYKTIADKDTQVHPALYEYTDTQARHLLYNLCLQYRRFESNASVQYEYLVKEGTVEANLNALIDTLKIDLVVLSREGQLAKDQDYYHSVLSYVVEEAHCPVLVVPPNATYKEIRELIFVTDLEENGSLNPDLIRFAEDMKAQIRLLMYASDTGNKNSDLLFDRFSYLQNNTGYNRIAFELQQEKNNPEGINQYCTERDAQMVVMESGYGLEPKKDSGLQNILFDSSFPMLICHKPKVPVYTR